MYFHLAQVGGRRVRAAVTLYQPTVAKEGHAVAAPVVRQVARPLGERLPGARSLLGGGSGLWWVLLLALAMTAVAVLLARAASGWLQHADVSLMRPLSTDAAVTAERIYARPSELSPAVQHFAQLQRSQSRWIEEQRRFLADATHQLRTPMAVLRTQLQAAMAGDMLVGEALAWVYVVVMWVTIGNGLRYGNRYLFTAVGMAAVSFGAVVAFNSYWRTNLSLGLGLLGGKYALELSRAGFHVDGINRSEGHLQYALDHGYIASGKTHDFEDLVRQADHIIFGLYPTVLLEWVKQYGHLVRPGTLITDVSGVKRGVVEPVQQMLPEGVEFIASHPMAGRETSGVAHSAEVNFAPANFIITPTEKNTPEAIEWCRTLARTLGFARISVLSPAEHDHMIGYVSQLCHAIAVSLMCASDNTELAKYTGDSFRDLTRIARINDKMWAELFLWNKENLISEIDQFDAALGALRNALVAGDREKLEEMFRLSTQRRAAFDKKLP